MYTPFKMKGKSPMMKKLIGNQHRLPEHLKAKIEAAPESPGKLKKSATKLKKESVAKLKKSATKMKKSMAKKKINPFSAEYKRMTVSQRKKKYGDDYKSNLQGSGKEDITRENIGKAIEKTKGKINKLNEKVQAGADKLSKDLKKTKQIKIAEKLGLKKKSEGTSSKKNDNKGTGTIDWKTAPAVGTKARTEWYKKHNLKLDDTTPALLKKSAAKMKKSSMKMKKSAAKLKKKTKKGLVASYMAVEGGAKKSMRGVKKGSLKNATQKGLTARELRIKRNKEFGPIAIKRGLAPKKPKAGDLSAKGRAELKAYEKFYSNKDNIKKLKKAQEQYFKNKK